MVESSSIEVFQDLTIWSGHRGLDEIRSALIAQSVSPWRHAPEREKAMDQQAAGSLEFIAFERDEDDVAPAVGLVLWRRPDCYQVSNIVPREYGRLTYSQYNSALNDFYELIALPVIAVLSLRADLTKSRQSLEDWASPVTADKLLAFSKCANKSTGASHPYDRERWLDFIISAHKEKSAVGGYLDRWLIEAEHWPEDIAISLVSDFEFAIDLLDHYDRQC